MRPISLDLPADSELREIREQLRALGPDSTKVPASGAEARNAALLQIDSKLDTVSGELRSLAEQTSFSELRATLPALCEKRPDEVAALLDLCLEDEEAIPQLFNLIDYLVTLLSTEWSEGTRQARPDPFSTTPRLQKLCEAMTESDPVVVQTHVDAFDKAILELAQAESVEPVIQRIRQYKERVGRLMFVPEVLQKIVEYNITVSNRLDDELEAERTMHELEAGVAEALAEADLDDESEPILLEDEESWVDPDTFEIQAREEMILHDVGEALGRRLAGKPSEGPAAEIAAALDVSGLSHWENQAFLLEQNEAEGGLLRSVVVVGLVVRHREALEPELALLGIDPDRLPRVWAPQLDSTMQKHITSHLTGSDYRAAKQLAQSRARYLHPILEGHRRSPEELAKREVEAKPAAAGRRVPRRSARASRSRQTATSKTQTRPRSRAARLVRVAAVIVCVVGAGLGIRTIAVEATRTDRPMASNQVRAISPYLESAVIRPGTHGPSFVATVREEWGGKDETFRTEEAIRVGNLLKQRHIHEMALFDDRYRMVAYFERGWLIYPTPSQR
jgi:hypothetical protein